MLNSDFRLRSVWTAALSLAMLVIALVASDIASPSVSAQSVVWANYDVTLTLRQDGSFHVVERQVVDFEGGPFSFAFADLQLARVEDITNVAVSEERGSEIVPYVQDNSQDPE